ncbi:MAG: hypothetical protein QM681_02510 [Novosphingobium sp.]
MIVLGRCLAAMFGGYAFASAAATLIAAVLPMAQAEAAWMGSILAVIFHVVAAIWCFAIRSMWTMLSGLIGAIIVLGALGLVLPKLIA